MRDIAAKINKAIIDKDIVIEEDGKLRIVSLNPFKKSRVAIAQIKRIDVNKSGLTLKIKKRLLSLEI